VDLLNGPNTFVSSGTYDALGNRVAYTDSNSKTTPYAYDPSGNLAQVTDALNQVTLNYYDPMGRLQLTVDPLGNRTQFTYNALSLSDALPNYTPALVPIELLLQIGLSIKSLRQGGQWNFEQFVALLAYSDGWSGI
jgi:YD repeat-containing protein